MKYAAIVVARALNRTLIIPPVLKNKHVSDRSPRKTSPWQFFERDDLVKVCQALVIQMGA